MFNSKTLDDIENYIVRIKKDLMVFDINRDDITDMAIEISSLGNMLLDAEKHIGELTDEKDTERLFAYKKTLNELRDQLNELNRLRVSNASFEEISRCSEVDDEQLSESQRFYKRGNEKLDSIISDAVNNLDSLCKQKRIIHKTRNTLQRGKDRIGSGIKTLKSISDRYLNDYYVFMIGLAIIVFFIVVVKVVL
ncbi:Golgi SNAP receptor complex member [Trachipleistophora hominis]|uniref:Golgi SNAP receptor complex member n=1 Tax=Trachipleistophora hominis TaxID=72359 RepID=L7K0K0_TRAHO|nr:Golgi SNAP receptor complex member [Trachipleistophora hominis]